MRSRMILLAAGLALAVLQAPLIPIHDCIMIALGMLILRVWRSVSLFAPANCFLLGLIYATLWAHWQTVQQLPSEMAGTDWQVEGSVIGVPDRTSQRQRFNLQVDRLQPHGWDVASIPPIGRLRLSWYHYDKPLMEGDQLQLIVRLKPLHSLFNPAAVDYKRWLMSRGIDATGYVRSMQQHVPDAGSGLVRLRGWISRQWQGAQLTPANSALFAALTTGSKQGFNDRDWALLRHSGTVHLAVISGLHIGFMAMVGWWLGRLISLLCYGRGFLLPCLGALTLALVYLLVSGSGLPAQRAFIMLSVLLLSSGRSAYMGHWDRWWLALVAVLLFNPLALFEVGFWLSFAAVGWLVYLAGQPRNWITLLRLQFGLLIGMLPLYLQFFSSISLAAPFINLLAIPLFALLVPLLFLHLLFTAFDLALLLPVLVAMADLFWWVLSELQAQEWLYQTLPALTPVSAVMLLVVLFLLLMPSGAFPLWLACLILLPVIVGVPSRQSDLVYEAWVFDVGQGLSVLIRVGDYHLLYDTGPGYPGGSSFAYSVQPFLEAQGIETIDDLVISHDDKDHNGGAEHLYRYFKIDRLHSSYPTRYEPQRRCRKGRSWRAGAVQFRFLHGSDGLSDNDRSCVLLIEGAGCRLMLPGDVSGVVEAELARENPQPVTWLLAAHHGSRSSTTPLAMRQWLPETVIFSSGFGNPFGHPHPEVVERVEKFGAVALNTAEVGAVRLMANSRQGCSYETMQQREKRFWR